LQSAALVIAFGFAMAILDFPGYAEVGWGCWLLKLKVRALTLLPKQVHLRVPQRRLFGVGSKWRPFEACQGLTGPCRFGMFGDWLDSLLLALLTVGYDESLVYAYQ